MFEIVNESPQVETMNLCDMTERSFGQFIVVSARGDDNRNAQSILTKGDHWYFWFNFYLKSSYGRTKFETVKEAIKSRYAKGYKVYILTNKMELKDFIKPRT